MKQKERKKDWEWKLREYQWAVGQPKINNYMQLQSLKGRDRKIWRNDDQRLYKFD